MHPALTGLRTPAHEGGKPVEVKPFEVEDLETADVASGSLLLLHDGLPVGLILSVGFHQFENRYQRVESWPPREEIGVPIPLDKPVFSQFGEVNVMHADERRVRPLGRGNVVEILLEEGVVSRKQFTDLAGRFPDALGTVSS